MIVKEKEKTNINRNSFISFSFFALSFHIVLTFVALFLSVNPRNTTLASGMLKPDPHNSYSWQNY